MREDLTGRFPIPECVWGNTEILRCVSDFHEVAKLVHDGLQSKKIALDGQTLPKIHLSANQGKANQLGYDSESGSGEEKIFDVRSRSLSAPT